MLVPCLVKKDARLPLPQGRQGNKRCLPAACLQLLLACWSVPRRHRGSL